MSNIDDSVKLILAPYRKRIDTLDEELVDMLVKRFEIIKEVANIKKQHDIPSVLQGRVDEVRDRAGDMAQAKGLDGQFVRDIYTLMIDYACRFEDEIMDKDTECHK